MAGRSAVPDLGRLHLQDDESDVEGLFDSPVKRSTTPKEPVPDKLATSLASQAPAPTSNVGASTAAPVTAAAREDALRAELAQLQQMNSTLEHLNQSLSTAKNNLQTMQSNMNSAKSLLKTWSSILSQAEHNQRLILDSRWQGATKDLEDVANEDLRRQADAQQKAVEENARREAAQRKQDEEVRKREADELKKTRGFSRARSVRESGLGNTAAVRGQSSASSVKGRGGSIRGTTSGIARGSTLRGRGRG